MLSRIDNVTGDLWGRHRFFASAVGRDIASLGIADITESLPKGTGTIPVSTRGEPPPRHYRRDADDSERHVLALLTLAQKRDAR